VFVLWIVAWCGAPMIEICKKFGKFWPIYK
jgi:hypothetical protein